MENSALSAITKGVTEVKFGPNRNCANCRYVSKKREGKYDLGEEIIYSWRRSFALREMFRKLRVITNQTLTTKTVLGGNKSIHSALGSYYMRRCSSGKYE
jgi:hypothetical protein